VISLLLSHTLAISDCIYASLYIQLCPIEVRLLDIMYWHNKQKKCSNANHAGRLKHSLNSNYDDDVIISSHPCSTQTLIMWIARLPTSIEYNPFCSVALLQPLVHSIKIACVAFSHYLTRHNAV